MNGVDGSYPQQKPENHLVERSLLSGVFPVVVIVWRIIGKRLVRQLNWLVDQLQSVYQSVNRQNWENKVESCAENSAFLETTRGTTRLIYRHHSWSTFFLLVCSAAENWLRNFSKLPRLIGNCELELSAHSVKFKVQLANLSHLLPHRCHLEQLAVAWERGSNICAVCASSAGNRFS